MTRSNWARATQPRPEQECPRCGEDRLTEAVEGRPGERFCAVCGQIWRAVPDAERPA